MKNIAGMKSINGLLNRGLFKLQKHSPEVLIVVGVIGTVVSTVLACRATTKISGVLDAAKEDIDTIHDFAAREDKKEVYSPQDATKDLTITYVQTGLKLAKLYAPAVIVGVVSITAILSAHGILRRRNLALAAAYATVDKGFKEYRKNVVEQFGEKVDHDMKYGIKAKTIKEQEVDPETGEVKEVEKTVEVIDKSEENDYSRFFDEYSTAWEKNADYNLMFLKHEQNYANDRLRARGHIFLNEIYDRLGFERTKAGQCVGWVYNGSNYVDFGLYKAYRSNIAFVNGLQSTVLLDFNVEGPIIDKI